VIGGDFKFFYLTCARDKPRITNQSSVGFSSDLLDGCNQSCGHRTSLSNYFAGQLEQNLIDALALEPDFLQVRAKRVL
jgi:hypothetical protein